MLKRILPLFLLLIPLACGEHDDHGGKHEDGKQEEGHGEHAHGPHDGHLAELGSNHEAHLEMVHDEEAGKLMLYVLGKDAKSPKSIEKAPQVKLSTDDGPKVLEAKGSGSEWSVTSDYLKGKAARGRVSIEVDGKTYNPEIEAH